MVVRGIARLALRLGCAPLFALACPVASAVQAWPQAAAHSAALEEQAEQAWQQAQQALQCGDWAQAELLLERVVMLAPQRADAVLELAHVMVRRGRGEAAQALVQALLDDPRTPPAYRQRLLTLLQPPAPGSAPETSDVVPLPGWRGQWRVGLGRHTNPLAQSSASQITLTPPGGSVTLPLQRRARDGYTLNAELDAVHPDGMQWQMQWSRTSAEGAVDAWRLGLQWPLPGAAWLTAGSQLTLSAQRGLDASGRVVAAVVAPLAQTPSGTFASIGLYREDTTSRQGVVLRVQAQSSAGPTGPLPNALGSVWAEAEQAGRPQPDIVRLGAALQWPLEGGRGWLGTAAQWQTDLQGYSPLLAGGAPRRMLSLEAHLSWLLWQPQPTSGGLVLRLAATRRYANIPLWTWRGAYVQLQWQQAWR